MPPRLDITPYWLIVTVAMGFLVLGLIVLAMVVTASRRGDNDK
jgi:hypothetical protein